MGGNTQNNRHVTYPKEKILNYKRVLPGLFLFYLIFMNMGRLTKLKKENIKKANELLEQGHEKKYPSKQNIPLQPSANVVNSPKSFVNKMNKLQEEVTEGTRCWKGYKKKGMKTMFGKRVPNCVKNEEVIKEAPEKGTYYIISKQERADLIAMGGEAKEIGDAASSDFSKYCR